MAPAVSPSFSISPDNGEQGEHLQVTISGSNGAQFSDWSGNYSQFRFTQYSETFYGGNIDYGMSWSGEIYAEVDIPSWANTGWWDVEVYDYGINSWLILDNGFYINSVPAVSPSFSISQSDNGEQGEYLSVYISGSGGTEFTDYSGSGNAQFRFTQYSETFYGNSYSWNSYSDYIDGYVNIPSWANTGWWDVEVYDYGINSWLILDNGFYINSAPAVSPSFSISPDNGEQGEHLQVTISGSNGAQFSDWSGNYSQFRFTQYSETFYGGNIDYGMSWSGEIYAEVDIPSWANTGWWDVEVYDYGINSWLILDNGFYINSAPAVSPSFTITPNNGEPGEYLSVYISGSGGTQFTDYSASITAGFRFTQYSETFMVMY